MYPYGTGVPIVYGAAPVFVAGPVIVQDNARITAEFIQMAGIDGHLDRQEFAQLYARLNPHLVSNPNFYNYVGNAFAQIDTNMSGKINLDEFLRAYAALTQHLI